MTPKSGEAGKAKMPPDPRKAGDTVDPKSGDPLKAQAAAIQKKAVKLGVASVSSYLPAVFAKPPTALIAKTLPQAKVSSSSTPPPVEYGYDFVCKHDKRRCNSGKTLQIVPDASGDVITCQALPQKQLYKSFVLAAADPLSAYQHGASPLANLVGRKFSVDAKIPAWYLLDTTTADPLEVFFVLVRLAAKREVGKTFEIVPEAPEGDRGRLIIYPSDNLTVSLSTDQFWEKIATPLEWLADKLRPFLGKTFNIGRSGFNGKTSLFHIDVKGPSLTVSGNAKWQERKADKSDAYAAYLTGQLKLAFDPFFGMEVKWDLGMVLAKGGAVAGIGAPFLVAYYSIKKLNGNEPPFYVTVNGSVGGEIAWTFDTGGPPSLGSGASGELKIGLGLQVGIRNTIAGKAEGTVAASVNAKVEGEDDAINLILDAKAGELKVTVEVKVKTNPKWLRFLDEYGVKKEFTFFDGWPSDPKKFRLDTPGAYT